MVVGLEPTSSEIPDWLQQIVLSHLSYTIFLTTYNNKYKKQILIYLFFYRKNLLLIFATVMCKCSIHRSNQHFG